MSRPGPQRALRVKFDRLLEELGPAGYGSGFFEKKTNEMYFVRPSAVDGCFEHVRLKGSTDGQFVRPRVRVGIVPGGGQWAGMFVEETLRELAPDNEGFEHLPTRAAAKAWEQRLVALAPQRNAQLAQREGRALLQTTARARAAAEYYLARLPSDFGDHEDYWQRLKRNASDELREQARLMLRAGLLTIPYNTPQEEDRAFYSYQIAAYTIVAHATQDVHQGFFPADTDPHQDHDWPGAFKSWPAASSAMPDGS